MKYLVITEKDSMLFTEQELREQVVSGKLNLYNSRVFSINIGQQRLHSVRVCKWPNQIPWVDIYDIFGNRVDTLKPVQDRTNEPHSPAYWDEIEKDGEINVCI